MRKESPEDIIKKLAHVNNLDQKKVREAVYFPFKVVADTMKSGKTNVIVNLPYFGKFLVKPNRLKHLKKKYGDKVISERAGLQD